MCFAVMGEALCRLTAPIPSPIGCRLTLRRLSAKPAQKAGAAEAAGEASPPVQGRPRRPSAAGTQRGRAERLDRSFRANARGRLARFLARASGYVGARFWRACCLRDLSARERGGLGALFIVRERFGPDASLHQLLVVSCKEASPLPQPCSVLNSLRHFALSFGGSVCDCVRFVNCGCVH
eukprot:859083-Pleurochrysis_carterae.AAC.1